MQIRLLQDFYISKKTPRPGGPVPAKQRKTRRALLPVKQRKKSRQKQALHKEMVEAAGMMEFPGTVPRHVENNRTVMELCWMQRCVWRFLIVGIVLWIWRIMSHEILGYRQ